MVAKMNIRVKLKAQNHKSQINYDAQNTNLNLEF